MNIAIISPEFPPYTNWGGVATFNRNLSLLLTRVKHRVYVITYSGIDGRRRVTKKNGITIVYVPFKTQNNLINFAYRVFPGGLFRLILNRFFPLLTFTIDWNIFSLLEFRRIHREIKFDAIHSPTYHMPSLLISTFYKKIPLYLHLQGPQELLNKYEIQTIDKHIKSRIENLFMKHYADKIVACSANVRNRIVKIFPECRKKIILIPNFIDVQLYQNNLPIDLNNIVFFGRLDYRKGIDILLKSFIKIAEINKNIKLYLIGQKSYDLIHKGRHVDLDTLLACLKISQSVKDRVFIFPRIDDIKTLIELLKKIKGIAIFPSRYEPFGFVTIEAMALGYVVIASNQGGGSEIIKNGKNGFLINPTQKSLVNALIQAIKLSEQEIDRIADNAFQTVGNDYSFEAAKKHFQIKLHK